MSMINHMIVEKKEKEKINKEIYRNISVADEVTNLVLTIKESREIIVDNLMFDYIIRVDEFEYFANNCFKAKVDFETVINMVRTEAVRLLRKDFCREEIYEMSWDDVANNLIRINKRLILSKIKEEYPDVYCSILRRANETTDKIIKEIS